MARSRNVKPGLFQNEELAELPMADRFLFIGLWTLADRVGILEDRVKRIKAQVFPYDDVDIDAALDRLAGAGFIKRYIGAGQALIYVVNFARHQSPHKNETASGFPRPDEVDGALGGPSGGESEHSENTPIQAPESSASAPSSRAPADSLTRIEETPSPTPSRAPGPSPALTPSTVLLPLIDHRMPRIAPDFSALNGQLSTTWLRRALAAAETEMDGGAGELDEADVLAALATANDAIRHALRTATDEHPIRNPPWFAKDQVVTALCERLNDVRDRRDRPATPDPTPSTTTPISRSRSMPDSVRRAGLALEQERHAALSRAPAAVADREAPDHRRADAAPVGAAVDRAAVGRPDRGPGSRPPDRPGLVLGRTPAVRGAPPVHRTRALHGDALHDTRHC